MRPFQEMTVQVLVRTHRNDVVSTVEHLLEDAPDRLQAAGLYLILVILWSTLVVLALTSGQF